MFRIAGVATTRRDALALWGLGLAALLVAPNALRAVQPPTTDTIEITADRLDVSVDGG
jgi:hypothetical protein